MDRQQFVNRQQLFLQALHNYPVNQMGGTHSEIPAFLINKHTVKTKNEAEAYISRLLGINNLFDQLLVNLKIREEKKHLAKLFSKHLLRLKNKLSSSTPVRASVTGVSGSGSGGNRRATLAVCKDDLSRAISRISD